MVYVTDLEGKITKINLTNSIKNDAELYEQTTLFKLNSSTDNGRYSYFSLDATIGRDSKAFWLFGGTGDFQRVNDVDGPMNNILYGIKDHDYPYFKSNLKVPRQDSDGWKTVAVQNINLAHDVDDPSICVDTTLDDTGELCPVASDDGWVVHLDDLANNKYKKLKLLGSGDIKEKFDFEVDFISNSAKEKIEKSGGKVTLIK
jgi:type IV pilus assembly protein PilY1